MNVPPSDLPLVITALVLTFFCIFTTLFCVKLIHSPSRYQLLKSSKVKIHYAPCISAPLLAPQIIQMQLLSPHCKNEDTF